MRQAETEATVVSRRHVFYAYGFDPATAARYRRLIMASGEGEASAIAPVSDISVGWTVTANGVETTFEVLAYEDIVTRFRNRPAFGRLASGYARWIGFLTSGGASRAWRLGRGPIWLWLHPLVMTCFFLILGYLPIRALAHWGGVQYAPLFALIVGGIIGLWMSYRAERAVFAHLMLALFEFMFRLARGEGPSAEMETRLDAFAKRIAAVPDSTDEVLIVGHSLGGWVAVRALAKAAPHLAGRRVGLLTLGSVAGFIACRGGPGSDAYARDVAALATTPTIFWTDVSAPRDWFSLWACRPALHGWETASGRTQPARYLCQIRAVPR